MQKCPSCGTQPAIELFSSIQCVNNECRFFDASWAEEHRPKGIDLSALRPKGMPIREFKQQGTQIGRWSCKDPNISNLPRTKTKSYFDFPWHISPAYRRPWKTKSKHKVDYLDGYIVKSIKSRIQEPLYDRETFGQKAAKMPSFGQLYYRPNYGSNIKAVILDSWKTPSGCQLRGNKAKDVLIKGNPVEIVANETFKVTLSTAMLANLFTWMLDEASFLGKNREQTN